MAILSGDEWKETTIAYNTPTKTFDFNKKTLNFKIHQNVSSQSLEIITNNNNLDYQIINMHGQIIKHEKLNNDEMVNISSMTNGIYMIKLIDRSNKIFGIQKFIKSN